MIRKYVLLIALLIFNGGFIASGQEAAFFNEIAAFKKQDSIKPPPKHAILFVGSSSFRMWKNIQQDFPGYTVINRGFGGSSLPDLVRYAPDIIYPYEPKQVVVYCGDNDLAASDTVTAEMVIDRFRSLYFLIRHELPAARITFVSIKPSPARERLLSKMKAVNKGIRSFLKNQFNTSFVNIFKPMMDGKGGIKTDLFLEDKLHMNAKGYAIWKESITEYLLKD